MPLSQSSIAAALLAFAVGLAGSLALAPGKADPSAAEATKAENPGHDGVWPATPPAASASSPWDDPGTRPSPAVSQQPEAAPAAANPEPTVQAPPAPRKAVRPAAARKAHASKGYRWKRQCRCRPVRQRIR